MSALFLRLGRDRAITSPRLSMTPELQARLSEASYIKKLKAAKRYLWARGIKPWAKWKQKS
jgi:hypothetical protein